MKAAIPAPAGQAHALLAEAAARLLGAAPSGPDVALALACLEGASLLADLGEDAAPTETVEPKEAVIQAASMLAVDGRAEARALSGELRRALAERA